MKIFKIFNKKQKKEEGYNKYSFKLYLKNFFLNGGEKITYYFINNNNIIETKTIMLKKGDFFYGTSLLKEVSSTEDVFDSIPEEETIFLTKEGVYNALEEKKQKEKNEKIDSFFS